MKRLLTALLRIVQEHAERVALDEIIGLTPVLWLLVASAHEHELIEIHATLVGRQERLSNSFPLLARGQPRLPHVLTQVHTPTRGLDAQPNPCLVLPLTTPDGDMMLSPGHEPLTHLGVFAKGV